MTFDMLHMIRIMFDQIQLLDPNKYSKSKSILHKKIILGTSL